MLLYFLLAGLMNKYLAFVASHSCAALHNAASEKSKVKCEKKLTFHLSLFTRSTMFGTYK